MIQVNEYRTTKTGKIGSFPKQRKEPRELHKKKIVNLIYYVHDSFRSAIPSFHSLTTTPGRRSFMRPAAGMSVMYSPPSSTQESWFGQCSCVFATRAERRSTRSASKKYHKIVVMFFRCFLLSDRLSARLVCEINLPTFIVARLLWPRRKKKSLKNVCCLVVEKAAEHRREAEKAK